MEKSTFVYVTYIRTTPEKLWAKLTETEVPREFFFATTLHASEWKVGAKWNSTAPDGAVVTSMRHGDRDAPSSASTTASMATSQLSATAAAAAAFVAMCAPAVANDTDADPHGVRNWKLGRAR